MCKTKAKKQRANLKKPRVIAGKPAIKVILPEEVAPPPAHLTALARADAVIGGVGSVCRGLIPTQRAAHGSAWQNLMDEDQTIRAQILEVKAKENRVLGMIRDQVSANLVETLETAVEQGVLNSTEKT